MSQQRRETLAEILDSMLPYIAHMAAALPDSLIAERLQAHKRRMAALQGAQMTSGTQPPTGRTYSSQDMAVLDKCVDTIKRFGWAIQCVIPAHGTPGWSYTVGLTSRGLPELLIRDMPFRQAGDYLNYTALKINNRVWDIRPGDTTTVVMHDETWWQIRPHPVRPGPGLHYSAAIARALYGAEYHIAVLELVPPENLHTPPGTPWPGVSCAGPGCTERH